MSEMSIQAALPLICVKEPVRNDVLIPILCRVVFRPKVAYRYATAADIDAYYGFRPPQTLKAIVVLLDEQPVGIIGLANEGGYAKLFSEYKPEAKPYLRSMTVLRAIKAAMRMVEECKLPVVATNQPDEADSPRLLQRLGFEFYDTSDDGVVYQWHPYSGRHRSRK